MRVSVKRTVSWLLAAALVLPGAMIFSQPLEAGAAETSTHADSLSAEPVKVPAGESAADFIKNPAQPDIYTLSNDYEVTRVGKDGTSKKEVNYQPYVATVGAAATAAEKAKVSKTITLPDFAGYAKPKDAADNTIDKYHITYQGIVDAAKAGEKTGDAEYGIAYKALHEYLYKGERGSIKVRHVFQDIKDFSKYGPKPGESDYRYTEQSGNLGDLPLIEPLPANETKGFVPENTGMKVVIAKDSITVEKRYNLAHFDVTYDTADGTAIPARTLYYGQVIPHLAPSDIPTKIGATFVGWKPSVDLKGTVNGAETTFSAGQLMKDGSDAIKNLNAKLIMPASDVKFTAVWEDRTTADYAIQFWTEKSDHADDADIVDKYEFMGTRVYTNQIVGSRPKLDKEPVKGLVFPDLDQARLNKIWNGDKFYQDRFLYLNKFYTYNKKLTDERNDDIRDPGNVKPVSATGKTVYNIYFDRQVYDLYFTKSNAKSDSDTFYPEIWRYHKQLGGPGDPYHFKARFNQRMVEWPNDALETKGFDDGKQSYGWGPNFAISQWIYRDTPPYRLSAKEFLDMPEYDNSGGYTSDIDAGDGVTIKANLKAPKPTFTTLSFGIEQRGGDYGTDKPIPHHMDFWMDGFDENPSSSKKIIDYDLYQTKADTNSRTYRHKPPVVQGFTPYEPDGVVSKQLNETDLAAMNDERDAETPLPDEMVKDVYGYTLRKGEMQFMYAFFNNADEYGDPLHREGAFDKNGYIRFHYKRNQYPLRFNTDPTKVKGDSQYTEKEQKKIFYQKPLKELDLDNVDSLSGLGLTDLLETDSNGKTRIKRPEGLAPNKVFKGWALDPAGLKMVSTSPNETMPHHALVLYAIWEEQDFKWKVTFDPDGGELPAISDTTVTTEQKTINEGDVGQKENVTYPVKKTDEGDKQIFTVLHRQKLVELQGDAKPTKDGYDFSGWEVLHYKKDTYGNYTDELDTSYRDEHYVPELYAFGNDVVSPIYLKAIWVPNNTEKVTVYHHYLDKEYHIDKTQDPNPSSRIIENYRAGQFVRTFANQDTKWLLAAHEGLVNSPDQNVKNLYKEYNDRLGFNNGYYQMLQVEPKKITKNGQLVDNPNYKNNVFHFFYVPFRTRNYKVNYVDERAKSELSEATTDAQKKAIIEKYRILDQEMVESKARHYDARNYKPIKGWQLTSAPQQQLFYDVDETTNEFKGINGTGSDEITFFYRDVRILEVPSTGTTTPPGYVRVTFKASDGGSFGKDGAGNPIKELSYVVLAGTKSDQLPVPQELASGAPPATDKYYVTPNTGLSFAKWDNNPLLPAGTALNESSYVFTAQFDRHPLVTKGIVTTESFTDPAGAWTNDFAPTLDALKGSIQQKENGVRKKLPSDATVKLFDEHNNEITTAAAIYELVKENGTPDTAEPVRTINLKAKVTFSDDPTNPREVTVPIRVYKNRYEANPSGEMPETLKAATTGPNGDLVDLLKGTAARNYVKVTVNPTNKLTGLSSKTYWVNPKAWVEIPEMTVSDELKASTGFKHWSADKSAQNEADGAFDFAKRHKFSENTTITPVFPRSPSTPGGNPGTPGTPGTPGGTPTPGTPTPGKPGTPTPGTPGKPGTPGTPGGNPLSPSGTPAVPGSPSVPSSPDQKDKSFLANLPETGANSLLYLYAAVLFTLTGALVLRIGRKRARD